MDLQDQLTKHLTDVHAIEEQALQQMVVAPRMAGDPELAQAFRGHLDETREQERRVRERLSTRGADPSRVRPNRARSSSGVSRSLSRTGSSLTTSGSSGWPSR